jgi:hypothetical protein
VWGKPDVVSMLNPAAFGSGTFNEVKAQNYLPRPGISGAAWETTMKAPRREFEEESDLHEGTSSRKVVFWPRARGAAGWRVGRRLACSLSVCAWQVSLYSARTSCCIRRAHAAGPRQASQQGATGAGGPRLTACTTGSPARAAFRANCAASTRPTGPPRRSEDYRSWRRSAVPKLPPEGIVLVGPLPPRRFRPVFARQTGGACGCKNTPSDVGRGPVRLQMFW